MQFRLLCKTLLCLGLSTVPAAAQSQQHDPPPLKGVVSNAANINTGQLLDVMSRGRSDLILVAAHRGYWATGPENSNGSLNAAFNSGIEAVEIDVRTTLDGHLIVSHDPDIAKETVGSGLISQMNLADIQKYATRDRDGRVQAGSSLLTFEAALNALINASSNAGRGPVIIADLKDPDAWAAYLKGVNDVKTKLNQATMPAVVFKMKMKNLPTTDKVLKQRNEHPDYGHLVLVVNPEDATATATGDDGPDWDDSVGSGDWSPSSPAFAVLYQMSIDSSHFVQQFELNINKVNDGAAQYIKGVGDGHLASFATYWEPRFYPEGVSTIRFQNNSPFTVCCYAAELKDGAANQDLRGVLNFSVYYNQFANPGVSLITADNLAETLNFLVSLGKRNISQLVQ